MKQSIRFIYFDVGGVFLDWKQGLKNAAAKHNVPLSQIEKVIALHWDHVGRGGDTEAYMEDLALLLNLSEPYPEVTDFWTDYHIPMHEMHNFVIELRAQYRMGLITNAERNAMHHAKRKGLIPNITWDVLVDSSELGVVKPEPKIFEIAEKAAGVQPHELLFIDDISAHIEAARLRGWHGVVFDTNNPNKSIQEIRSFLEEESL